MEQEFQITVKDHLFFLDEENPIKGFNFEIKYDKDTMTAFGTLRIPEYFQGVDGRVVHEGFLGIILAEAIDGILKVMEKKTYPLRIQYRFLKPAAINSNLYVRAWFVKDTDDIIDLAGEIENEMGKIVARIKARFITREIR